MSSAPAAAPVATSSDPVALAFDQHRVNMTKELASRAESAAAMEKAQREQMKQQMQEARKMTLQQLVPRGSNYSAHVRHKLHSLPGTVTVHFTARVEMPIEPMKAGVLPVKMPCWLPSQQAEATAKDGVKPWSNAVMITSVDTSKLAPALRNNDAWIAEPVKLVAVRVHSETPSTNHSIRFMLQPVAQRLKLSKNAHTHVNGTWCVDAQHARSRCATADPERSDDADLVYVDHQTLGWASSDFHAFQVQQAQKSGQEHKPSLREAVAGVARAILTIVEEDNKVENVRERRIVVNNDIDTVTVFSRKPGQSGADADAEEAQLQKQLDAAGASAVANGGKKNVLDTMRQMRSVFVAFLIEVWNSLIENRQAQINLQDVLYRGFFTVTQEAWQSFLKTAEALAQLGHNHHHASSSSSSSSSASASSSMTSTASHAHHHQQPLQSSSNALELLSMEAVPEIMSGLIDRDLGALMFNVKLHTVAGVSPFYDVCVFHGKAVFFVD
jgi:hypothetical protein